MADERSNDSGGGGLFGRLSTLAVLLQVGRALRRGNIGRAGLLVGSVVLGRFSPRLKYLLQVADTANQVRKRFR